MNVQTAYDALKCCFIKREREREKKRKSLIICWLYILFKTTSSCNHLIGLPQSGSEITAVQVHSALSARSGGVPREHKAEVNRISSAN